MKVRFVIPSLDPKYHRRRFGCILCRRKYNALKSTASDYDGFCSRRCEDIFYFLWDVKDFFKKVFQKFKLRRQK